MRLDKDQQDDDRFAPRVHVPEGTPAGPVVIQVQLKTPVQAPLEETPGSPRFAFTSPSGADLGSFQQTLNRNGLLKAEPSFRSVSRGPEETALSSEVGREAEKQKFLDLHFPSNSDPNAIASELRGLPEVERAVVKPKAIPPS